MPEQFDMRRVQRVSFTAEEAERINKALDIMKKCTGKDVTPNRFIKVSTVDRAKIINEEGGKQ